MKRLLALMLCAVGIAAMTACASREQQPPTDTPKPDDTPTVQEETADPQPKVDDAFIKDVVLNFGAIEQTDENGETKMIPQVISLYYRDRLDSETMTPGDMFSWYLSYAAKEDLTDEERAEKYNNPEGEDMGWFFPSKYYEPVCIQYFEVTQEFLRSDSMYYKAEHDGYSIEGGGGIGERPPIIITGYEAEGEIVTINLKMESMNPGATDKVLTIKLTDEGYKYQSYLPAAL